MKTLPDNPHLDHLRQQAKDLLAGLRDSEPGTSLAQAQARLAAQYGFRTWTDLKAEVDGRHGQADVADPALAREIAARYGLGEVTGAMRSVSKADWMGRQWSLETDRGRWAVRTTDSWIPIVDAETDVALQEAAAAAGILLPAPMRSRTGAIVESIGEHRWRVNQWRHSGPPLAAPVSATIARQVGEILATLHGLNLPADRISPWHAARLSAVEWSALATTAQARGRDWAAALTDTIPVLADLEAIGEDTPPPAPVLSYNTLGPGDVRVGADGRLVLLGWERAGGQPPSWELCDALTHWTVDPSGGVNAAGARAMVEGYRSRAGSLPPLRLAMFRGAAISLLNYVAGEVDRALTARDGEERRDADRSVRHLLSQLPSRATLEALLDTVENHAAAADGR